MKGMMTSLWLIVGGVMFFSCESSDDQVVVDIDIAMTIENTGGDDLLNPATENYIQPASIHVFYEIDGKRETYESINKGSLMDHPEGFIISPPEGNDVFGGKYFLKLFSNPTAGDHVVTVIEIDGHDDLTLVTQVTHAKGNTRVEKISYNDNVVWATDSAQPKYVKVVY